MCIHLSNDSVKLPDGLVLQQLVQEDLEVGIRDHSQVLSKHAQGNIFRTVSYGVAVREHFHDNNGHLTTFEVNHLDIQCQYDTK